MGLPTIRTWLKQSIPQYLNNEFEGSENERGMWETIAAIEAELGCDSVRGFRFLNTEEARDTFAMSFSYFSIAALGLIVGCECPHLVNGFLIIGQDEEMNEERHLRSLSLLDEPLDVFIRTICEYSIDYDHRFRKLIQNVPSETHKPVAD